MKVRLSQPFHIPGDTVRILANLECGRVTTCPYFFHLLFEMFWMPLVRLALLDFFSPN